MVRQRSIGLAEPLAPALVWSRYNGLWLYPLCHGGRSRERIYPDELCRASSVNFIGGIHTRLGGGF